MTVIEGGRTRQDWKGMTEKILGVNYRSKEENKYLITAVYNELS